MSRAKPRPPGDRGLTTLGLSDAPARRQQIAAQARRYVDQGASSQVRQRTLKPHVAPTSPSHTKPTFPRLPRLPVRTNAETLAETSSIFHIAAMRGVVVSDRPKLVPNPADYL